MKLRPRRPLTPRQSAAVACLLDGLNFRQSAEAIGCTVSAFEKTARRARDKLRDQRLTVRWIRARGTPC